MDNRRNSLRLIGYDYSLDGSYFITICSHKRQNLFSSIVQNKIQLSSIGKLIDDALNVTSSIRKYVTIGESTIMPNHIHFILHIHKNSDGPEWLPARNVYSKLVLDDEYKNKFGPQMNNVPSIIRGIKAMVTMNAKKNGFVNEIWQRSYHDHIIRNQEELIDVENYINENSIKWFSDEYFTK